MLRGGKNLPIISRRLRAHRIRRGAYLVLLTGLCFGLAYSFLTGKLGTFQAKASLSVAPEVVQLENGGQTTFGQNETPTFVLDTAGQISSADFIPFEKEKDFGDGKKISTQILYNTDPTDQKLLISPKSGNSNQFKIEAKAGNQFRPGKYQVKAIIKNGGDEKVLTQDFTWGVLAINFNQSTYNSGEQATIGIAVLDDHGVTECSAKLKLTITAPDNQKTILSTENKEIVISPTCHNGNVTNEFDYAGNYMPKVEGEYQVKLEAETTNGKRETTESFEVNNNPDFVIKRLDTSMRIFPESPYRVNVAVMAYQPLNGQIKEKVPASFAISDISAGGSIVDKTDTAQTIVWPATLAIGQEIQLSYTYDAPDISPEFYLLGPLEIWQNVIPGDGGQVSEAKIFSEPRAWQIATDATACSSSTTTGTMNWGTSTTWASPCAVSGGPTVNNDVTITNTVKVITVEASTTRAANSITFTAGTSATTLQLSTSGGAVLNVNGTGAGGYGIFITGTSAATKTVAVAQNTLSATSIRITSGSSSRIGQLTITTGTVNVTAGGITYSGTAGTAKVVFSNAGTINLTGDFTPGLFTCSTGKVNANGSGAQSLGAFTYYNLDINNTGNSSTYVSFAGNPTISGALNINDGTLDLSNDVVGVTLGTTVGANGTALFSSVTGLKTFTGDVTVNGIWSETAAVAVTFVGSLTNNATTWTASTGVHIFSGTGKTISGSATTAIPKITINGTTGNSGTIDVSTTLAGSSTLTNNAGGTLLIGAATASVTITGLTASAATNTVNYDGTGGQTVEDTTDHHYSNLTITTGAGTATLAAGTTVDGNLTVTSGTLQLSTFSLTVTGTSSVTGTIDDSSTTGTNIFVGLITVQATTGTWTSTGNSAYEIRGGIRNYNTFTGGTGTYTFTTGSQDIDGDHAISFGGAVSITGAINISNKNTSTVTITGALDGSVSGSTWINTANSSLYYASTTAMFATNGTLTASANPNTVNYNATGGSQTVKGTTYDTLILANTSGTDSAGDTITVNTGLSTTASGTLNMATYQLLGGFTPTNGGIIRTQNTAAAPIPTSKIWAGTVQYDSTAAGQTISAGTYNNLIVDKTAQTATLGGVIVCDGDLTITSGILDTSGSNFAISVAGNWSNSGSFAPNGGTVTFNKGSSSQTLDSGGVGAGKIFNSLTHSGAGTLQLITNAINIDGIFTNSAGTFDANDLNMNVADDFLDSGGTFSADVSPGATTQTVTFDGTNEATVSGSTTFNNLTMNTTTDGAKTIKFTVGTIQTIANTWTLDGDVGKVLTLKSTTDTSAWKFVIPADINPAGDYIDVRDSQNTTNAYRITAGDNTNDLTNNDPGWLFPSANTAPTTPISLVQKKVTGGATLATGDWTNETQVEFTATTTDPDASDTLYLCVEKDVISTSLSDSDGGDLCGTGVANSSPGDPINLSVTIDSGLADGNGYHWQAQAKDAATTYSGWTGYGSNTENPPTNPAARDFGVDASAPTGGTIYDGTDGTDDNYNSGSLSALSAYWTSAEPNFDLSGKAASNVYQYAIGTTQGGNETKDWTATGNSGADSYIDATGLALRTGQTYYFSIKATDAAGNIATVNSNGQAVEPTLIFSYFSGGTITFDELNSGNSWTDSAKTTVLQTSTNAYSGYVIKARTIDKLRHTGNISSYIDYYAGANSTPTTWSGAGFGYTTSDSNLSGGTADRFTNGGPKYAGFTETGPGDPVADNTANVTGTPISNEQFTITYRVTGNSTTPAGKYTTTIIYTCIPQY